MPPNQLYAGFRPMFTKFGKTIGKGGWWPIELCQDKFLIKGEKNVGNDVIAV